VEKEDNAVISKNSQKDGDKHTWIKAETFFYENRKSDKECHGWGNEPCNVQDMYQNLIKYITL
jgi:hypothetical protein